MKAVFLCNFVDKFPKVYNDRTIAAISDKAEAMQGLFTEKDLIDSPEKFSDVEVIFSTWGMPVLTEEQVRRYLPKLKCIFYAAGSVQAFARPYMACGVRIFSGWSVNAVPVAEVAVAQIILANKGYFLSSRLYHDKGNTAATKAFEKCCGNFDENVGLIGAGMIGSLVAKMLKAYDLNVLVFDPFLSDERAQALGVKRCSLEELFSSCAVVSNHLADNEQTRGMLDYSLFKLMRENGVFINTGRGAQVVEPDLVRILTEREDLTALLDVTHPEPCEEGHPFYTLRNCLLTPHIAGCSGKEMYRLGRFMSEEFERFLKNEHCSSEVTAEMLKTMA